MIYSLSTIDMFFPLPKLYKNQRGQLLISVLIAIAIFLILAHALFTLISASFEMVSFNKARITARHLAQEKMETIRNLGYDQIGTVGGIPSGVLEQEEKLTRNGLSFTINTDVVLIDDPFDETAPSDTSPGDYKRARVEVSWEGLASSNKNPLILVTDISANATTTTEGGTLTILVFNANGDPVEQAEVTIVASSLTPPVNLSLETDSEGKVTLPGATQCVACYEITVTKSGMSTDRTYSTSEVANPIKPHTGVFEDDVTQISFAIDTLGIVNINSVSSRENAFTPLGGVPFRIHGNKIIGTNASAEPVYKYDTTTSTDGSGLRSLNNMEWDVYHIEMPASTAYDISGTDPLLPLNLTPAGSLSFKFTATAHTTHSFFLTVKDPTQTRIASASAQLTESGGFNESRFTGNSGDPDFGQLIFSNLDELTYTLTATAEGFLNYNGSFDVSGTTAADIVLTPE